MNGSCVLIAVFVNDLLIAYQIHKKDPLPQRIRKGKQMTGMVNHLFEVVFNSIRNKLLWKLRKD